jgi:hypothetical protein
VGYNGQPPVQRREEYVEETANPGPVRRRPEQIPPAWHEIVRKAYARQVSKQDTVAVQGPLGRASCARSVDNDRRILRLGNDRFEAGRSLLHQAIESNRGDTLIVGQDNVPKIG